MDTPLPSPAPTPQGWPAGTPVAVVVYRVWTRAVMTVVGGVLLVGLLIAVLDAVRTGDASYPWRDSGLGGTGQAVGWVVLALIALALAFGIASVWIQRFEFGAAGVRARLLRRWIAFPVGSFEEIRYRPTRGRATMMPKASAVQVRLRDSTGRRRTLSVAATFMTADAATPVLTAWVRARPELVRDPATAQIFGIPLARP